MKKILLGLVVLIFLAFIVFYVLNTNNSDNPNTEIPDTNTSQNEPAPQEIEDSGEVADIPNGYRLYTEPDYGYSIALPFAVDTSTPQTGTTRYRYLGLNNQPGSEITDGYTITITSRTANATSVEALALQEIQGKRQTVQEEPTIEELAGTRVSHYTTESELGNSPLEHYAFLPGNNFEYIVSINSSPHESNQYQEEIQTILDSLTFLSKSEAVSLASRTIPIAMLDYTGVGGQYSKESGGIERGCDKVVLIQHTLAEATTTPLNASLQQLFSYDSDTVGGWQNFIASQNKTLFFDHAEIKGSKAEIYLTGELGALGGVCDNPRTAIQIEETALAYSTVDSVQLYLNGEPSDLTPSGKGE